jgi:transcriptional regulator with XRE-family HTH domain
MQESNHKISVENGDMVAYLQGVLLKRCRDNPAYSLRALARQLQVEPSFLSKILNRKRRATPAFIQKVSGILMLEPSAVEEFKLASLKRGGETPGVAPKHPYQDVSLDAFLVIADWYHYAILELTRVKGFKLEPRWIAGKLGITSVEAQQAVQRLTALRMLEIDAKGKLVRAPGSYTTIRHAYSHSAFRKLQKQILTQALEALEEVPMAERDQSSITIAIDKKRLAEAKEKIVRFRREMSALLQPKDADVDSVYQLSISLFPAKKGKLKPTKEGTPE